MGARRRHVLVPLAALATAAALSGGASAESPWPFDPPPAKLLRQSPRKVFAHYFTPFPISLDNKEPEKDYYALNYLSPDGENGKFRASGGFLRQRPLPRPPLPGKNWAELDMEEEVRRAVAIGLDGFACDLLSTSGALPVWPQRPRTPFRSPFQSRHPALLHPSP